MKRYDSSLGGNLCAGGQQGFAENLKKQGLLIASAGGMWYSASGKAG
jgi:hypothetical protein